MLIIKLILCIVFLFILSVPGFAKETKFTLGKDAVSMSLPDKWGSVLDTFGIPLMVYGPMKNGRRPVIGVTPTGVRNIAFDQTALEKDQVHFLEGRKEWLGKAGKPLKLHPYRKLSWPHVSEVHAIGYRYQILEAEFVENSYYVLCKNQLFHLKTLVLASQEKEFNEPMEKTLRSFKCE